jgi:hypothetical protein
VTTQLQLTNTSNISNKTSVFKGLMQEVSTSEPFCCAYK